MPIGTAMGRIIGIVIGVYIMAATVPDALTTMNAANTTGWTTAQAALWPIIGLLVIVAIVGQFIGENM
jgi:hypothetical protein